MFYFHDFTMFVQAAKIQKKLEVRNEKLEVF